MADKNINKVHEIYPVLFKRSWPCNFNHPFAPLVISSCNADGNIPFSKAAMNVRAVHDCAIAELFLYRGAYYDIVERETPRSKQALECLGQYLNDAERHLKCLKALRQEDKKLSECDVQSTVAVHLFAPLVANGCIITADALNYSKSECKPECPTCKTTVNIGDTSIGNHNVWHGIADLLLEQSVVTFEKSADSQDTLDETNEYENIGWEEPCGSKRRRMDRLGSDDESEASDEESDIASIIEEKISFSHTYMPYGPEKLSEKSWNSMHAKVLSQTIVNAFFQVSKNPELKNSFFPCFLVSDKYLTIHMYNRGLDILLTYPATLPIFEDYGAYLKIDTETILCLWLALNMHQFSRQLPNETDEVAVDFARKNFVKSNFPSCVGPTLLEIYKNNLEAPLPERESSIMKRYYYNCEVSTDYVRKRLKDFN